MSMEAGSEFVERVPREFILRMRSLGQNSPLRWITVSAVARIILCIFWKGYCHTNINNLPGSHEAESQWCIFSPWKQCVKETVITLLFVNDFGWILQHFKEEILGFLMVINYWYVYIDFFWVNWTFIPTLLTEIPFAHTHEWNFWSFQAVKTGRC